MALPRKLKNFIVFKDGISYQGQAPEVTLPVLTRKMEDYQAGGMGGPVKQDIGMEALSMEYKMAGWADGSHSGFGAVSQSMWSVWWRTRLAPCAMTPR